MLDIKYIIEGIVIIVIALFIFSYFTNPMTNYQVNKFFSDVKGKFSSVIEKVPTSGKIGCRELAKELIPDTFILYSPPGSGWLLLENSTWNDGSEIENSVDYQRGSEKSQNINYYYPTSRFFDEDPSLIYSKEIIGKEGVIFGKRMFKMQPILRPIVGSEGEYIFEGITTFIYTSKEFEIIELNIVYCHWITDEGEVIE